MPEIYLCMFPSDQLVFVVETEFVYDTLILSILHAYKYHYKYKHILRAVGCYYIKHCCALFITCMYNIHMYSMSQKVMRK